MTTSFFEAGFFPYIILMYNQIFRKRKMNKKAIFRGGFEAKMRGMRQNPSKIFETYQQLLLKTDLVSLKNDKISTIFKKN